MRIRLLGAAVPPLPVFSRGRLAGSVLAVAAMGLSGCATLPSSGPTASEVEQAARDERNQIGYEIVDITPEVVRALADDGPGSSLVALEAMASFAKVEPVDLIRAGDQLAISIYEVGVSLFGAVPPGVAQQGLVGSPVANAQRIGVQVDEQGKILLPYVGIITAAGRLPIDLQNEIQARMRPFSQSPQVMVQVAETVENVTYLTGAISRPGRYRLSAARERLMDAIAIAGGPSLDPNDAEVRLVRGDRVAVARLGDLRAEAVANLVLLPGDRIEIVRDPRTFTVFGASDKVSQVAFGGAELSLTEAVARAGGPSDARADPAGVFLFRYDPKGKPTIYKLNMRNPQNYFLAQRFQVRDKDVLYFSNSATNPPAKLINLINQLFAPLATASIIANSD